MRRTVVLLAAVAMLGACGDGGTADRGEVARLQDEVDSAARIVAITVSEALTGTLPPGTSLGTGRSASCSDGSGLSYSVGTAVTHSAMDAATSLRAVARELRREGYEAEVGRSGDIVRVELGDAVAGIRARGSSGSPVAHQIEVGTGCVRVGRALAAEVVDAPGRDVRR